MTVFGCDISHYQSTVPAGLDFYFHKCTEGVSTVDPSYESRHQYIRSLGKVWGAYHFFRMTGDSGTQVSNFVQNSFIEPGDIIALDFEDVSYDPWSAYTTQDVAVKCGDILRRLQLTYPRNRIILYCDESTLSNYVEPFHIPSYDGLWIADYSQKPITSFMFWQYSDIPYDKDLSDNFTTLDDLKVWCHVESPYIAPLIRTREDETMLVPAGDDHVTIVSQGASRLVAGCGFNDIVNIQSIDSWGSNESGWNSTPVGIGGHVGEFTLNANEPLDIPLPAGSVITIVKYNANHSWALGIS